MAREDYEAHLRTVPLFAVDTPVESVGTQVVATELYAAQRAFVPKAPDKQVVAIVIDALLEADGSLSLSAVAAAELGVRVRHDVVVVTVMRF